MIPRRDTNETITSFFDSQAERYQDASERWPWRWLRTKERAAFLAAMGSISGETVLDLGCGAGYFSRLFIAHGASKALGVDLSEAMISQLKGENIEGVVGDIASVNLGLKFHKIACAGALEFVPDPQAVLSNARDHIEPDGRLVILMPLQNIWGRLYRLYHRRHGLRINLFRPNEVRLLARQTGWQQLQETYVPPFSWIAEFGPIDR